MDLKSLHRHDCVAGRVANQGKLRNIKNTKALTIIFYNDILILHQWFSLIKRIVLNMEVLL